MPTTTPAPGHDVTRVTLSVLGIGLLLVASFWVLRPFLGALVWATMIVVATWPLLLALQARLGRRRGPAVAVLTLAMLLVLFVPLYLAVSTIAAQSDRIAAFVRALPTARVPAPPDWLQGVPLVGDRAAEAWAAAAEDPQRLKEALAPRLKLALAWFGAQAGSFGSMLVHFLLTVLLSAILYAKGEAAAEQLRRFFRRLSGERGNAIVELSGKAIRAVALGVVVTAVVQSAIAGIALGLLGVPFAGLLTAVALILCIAQLGPLLAMLPGVVWLYASGSPGRGTALLVVMLGTQALDNVLRPLLIKKGGADLSLLLIISGVIGGLLWLGVIGLFVGPVVLAVTSTLLDGWIASRAGEATQEGSPPVASAAGAAPHGGGGVSPSP
jgi:predicted PurR-regulated permease PerM